MHALRGSLKQGIHHVRLSLTIVGLFYGVMVFIYMAPSSYHSPQQDNVVSLFYSLITPTLNPLIYS